MNHALISNYMATVKEEDTFYFLGDFSWDTQKAKGIWKSLPGRKIFIKGNHDSKIDIPMLDMLDITIEKQPITLCHYPMITFNKSHFGAFNLYGHHHNNPEIQKRFPGKRIDVGVDKWNFFPVSYEEIKKEMDKLPDNWDLIRRDYYDD
jgi:calcineurin-like phosphoesterase family protein